MTRPAWLATWLDEKGLGPASAARAARRTTCRRCGSVVVRGLDGDVGAFTVSVDPEPLDARGEFLARWFFKVSTYALRKGPGGRPELDRRDRWQIEGEPAGTREAARMRPYVVVSEHRCPNPEPPTPEAIRAAVVDFAAEHYGGPLRWTPDGWTTRPEETEA